MWNLWCLICYDLKKHISSVNERKRPSECQICSAKFKHTLCSQFIKERSLLNVKSVVFDLLWFEKCISSVHEGKKPFKCKICTAIFENILCYQFMKERGPLNVKSEVPNLIKKSLCLRQDKAQPDYLI